MIIKMNFKNIFVAVLSIAVLSSCANSDRSPGDGAGKENGVQVAEMPCTPDNGLAAGAKILFSCAITNLSSKDRNTVFSMSAFILSADTLLYASNEDVEMGMPLNVSVSLYDIDQDGTDEVLLNYGNELYGGTAGNPAILFSKDKSGEWRKIIEGFSSDLLIMDSRTMGWPDLVMGGGMNHMALMKWNGKTYKRERSINDQELGLKRLIRLSEVATGTNSVPG
jgi:hypothetical protein